MSPKCITIVLAFVICAGGFIGCAEQHKVVTTKEYGANGTLTHEVTTDNDNLIDELQRILSKTSTMGKGSYTNENASTAREVALNLAINDLGRKLGEVIQESDSTIIQQATKDTIMNVIRTRASNILRGYEVIADDYDPTTHTAEVVIRMETYSVAKEIATSIQ